MAKASAATSVGDSIHTRTTAGSEETTAVVIAEDGTDNVAALAAALLAGTERGLVVRALIQGATQTAATGTITTATSVVGGATDYGSAGNITVTIDGTYAGVNATFEVSDDAGTTWYATQGQRIDSGVAQSATGVLASNSLAAWNFSMLGYNRFRVRATAYTSGTANVAINPGTMPFQPVASAVSQSIGSAASAVTNTAASASNVTLKAANTNRKALYIFNAGTSNLFVKLGATATATTSFTHMIAPNGLWELPDDPIYTGIVDGIWTATGGNGALVTELT